VAAPLYEVVKKDIPFEWEPVQEKAQLDLKTLIELHFHTRNPKFSSEQLLVLAMDTLWQTVGYYLYQRDEEESKHIHYAKFNSLLMDNRQQRYSQPKRELCGLWHALEQEGYLLKGCRNFIVETDTKYLAGMLNDSEKMPNATINYWVDYIQTNFFFELVHKKGKTFGPDGLSRRQWYPRDPITEDFVDGLEDGSRDIVVRQGRPQEEEPLELETFYEDIDSREGYYHRIMESNTLMELGHSEPKIQIEVVRSRTVYAEIVEPKDKKIITQEEEEPEEYDKNRQSEYTRKQEIILVQIKNYLTTRDKSQLETMTADQAKFM